MTDVRRESANFYRDRLGVAIRSVTLHSTRGGERTRGRPAVEFDAALNWLSQVSYEGADGATYRNPSIHYIVGHDGRLATVVPERHGAWHAGTGADREGANLNAIGIELVQPTADTPYPEALIARAVSLVAEICHRHDIPARRTRDDAQPGIHHHSDLTAGKSDPGPLVAQRGVHRAGRRAAAVAARRGRAGRRRGRPLVGRRRARGRGRRAAVRGRGAGGPAAVGGGGAVGLMGGRGGRELR